jgi:hypothetical protein
MFCPTIRKISQIKKGCVSASTFIVGFGELMTKLIKN